jgi:cell division protein FtsB
MRFLRLLIIIAVVGLLSWGFYDLHNERKTFQREVNELRLKKESLEAENKSLEENIEYFKNPKNLIKELKSKFNYREEGEKLIIIVPPPEKFNTTSTQ